MKQRVHHHSSNVIIQNGDSLEFMFQVYDSTYPRIPFRMQVQLIGGNYQAGDCSPLELFKREICEEFSQDVADHRAGVEKSLINVLGEGPGAQPTVNFAPLVDITTVRKEILLAQPYQDFVYSVPELAGRLGFTGVTSIYHTSLNPETFERVRANIAKGLNIKNEGAASIASVDDIQSGRTKCAWYSAEVLGRFLGMDLPQLHGIRIEPIGLPQDSWESYLDRFEYEVAIM